MESFVTFSKKLEPAVHSDASTGPVKKNETRGTQLVTETKKLQNPTAL